MQSFFGRSLTWPRPAVDATSTEDLSQEQVTSEQSSIESCVERPLESPSEEEEEGDVHPSKTEEEASVELGVEPQATPHFLERSFSSTFDKLGLSSKEQCVACAAEEGSGNSSAHWAEIRRLLTANRSCLICSQMFCNSHCEFFSFPPGLLPDRVGKPYVCLPCKPQAQQLLDDDMACIRQKRLTNANCQRGGLPMRLSQKRLDAYPERSHQCIECDAVVEAHCQICGFALCSEHLISHPLSSGSQASGRLTSCAECLEHCQALAQSRTAVRRLIGNVFRNALGARCLESCIAGIKPDMELAEDCASCGLMFTILPGSLRHHCRACGRSLCSSCLCGRAGCLAQGPRCPHKAKFPQYGYEKEERMCAECLPLVHARQAARSAADSIVSIACKYADHCIRVTAFMEDPDSVPFYTQEFVDTTKDKLYRAGTMAVEGAKFVAPVLSVPWALGVRAFDLAWKYGQYGLVGLLCQSEIMEGLKTLLTFSAELQNVQPRDLIVGMIYLSAEQRKVLRDEPERNRREIVAAGGVPVCPALLEVLIGMAVLSLRAPYEDNAFEAQRFALQQGWRLVTERLSESWKHRPAWCLYMDRQQHMATVAVRGTDIEQSCGGDLFTNINVLPESVVGANGVSMSAHAGMLAAARALESELRPTLTALVRCGYRIVITGHSLGAAVAALLVWLVHFGDDGERLTVCSPGSMSNAGNSLSPVLGIGYGTPACVDRGTGETLRPLFTSVVNSVDVVPRLSSGALATLSNEITSCAQVSGSDLDQDVKQYVERLSTVWAPRIREGSRTSNTAEASDGTSSASSWFPGWGDRGREQETVTSGSGIADATRSVSVAQGSQVLDLFVPGNVVWIHRVHGHLEAALVPCDLPPLRRIVLDKRMITDHRGVSYHEGMRAVRARQAIEATAPVVSWQGFSKAGEVCPCCRSVYEWMKTARSGKSRVHAMTNCRACGLVVCIGCAETRRTLPEQGILHPSRICDRCAWRVGNTDISAALNTMPELFSKMACANSRSAQQ